MEELLENDLEISKATLLELTLTNIKNKTIKFAKRSKIRDDHTEETLKEELQELICEDTDDTNLEEIQAKQEELGAFEEQKLFNILSKKKNFLLLDDERPTQRFLAIESIKAGYSEITRLRVKKPGHNPALPLTIANKEFFEVTENKLINSELLSTFRDIYKLQQNLNLTDTALDDYMNSDGDTAPNGRAKQKKTAPYTLKKHGRPTDNQRTHPRCNGNHEG